MHNLVSSVAFLGSRSSKCTKIVSGWGFAPYPTARAYTASPDRLAKFKGSTSKAPTSKEEGRKGRWRQNDLPPGSRNPPADSGWFQCQRWCNSISVNNDNLTYYILIYVKEREWCGQTPVFESKIANKFQLGLYTIASNFDAVSYSSPFYLFYILLLLILYKLWHFALTKLTENSEQYRCGSGIDCFEVKSTHTAKLANVGIKSNQIKWCIRYSSTDAGLQQYRGNVFTTNNITNSVSWQHNSSDINN